MRKSLFSVLILVLVIALATCFMTVGCAEETPAGPAPAASSQGTGRISTSKQGGDSTVQSTIESNSVGGQSTGNSTGDVTSVSTSVETSAGQSVSQSATDGRDPDTPFYN